MIFIEILYLNMQKSRIVRSGNRKKEHKNMNNYRMLLKDNFDYSNATVRKENNTINVYYISK